MVRSVVKILRETYNSISTIGRLGQRGDRVWEGSGVRGSREVRGNGRRKSIYESGRRRKMHESKNLLICRVSLEIKDLRQETKV